MKLHIKRPKINTKVLLIVGALLVIAALFSFAVVKQVQAERQANIVAGQEAAKRSEIDRAKDVRIKALEQQVAALQVDKMAACTNYKALAGAKATKSLVVIPTAVHCE